MFTKLVKQFSSILAIMLLLVFTTSQFKVAEAAPVSDPMLSDRGQLGNAHREAGPR